MKYHVRPKIRTDGCHTNIRLPIPRGASLDEGEWDRFSRQTLRGFFKADRCGPHQIEYSGPVSIPLCDRLQKPVSKYEFFVILEQILVAAEGLQRYGLPASSVLFDIHLSFINEITSELFFLYYPIRESDAYQGLFPFVEDIVYSAVPFAVEGSDYIAGFMYFLRSLPYFDLSQIEQYIIGEEPQAVIRVRQRTDIRREKTSGRETGSEEVRGQNTDGEKVREQEAGREEELMNTPEDLSGNSSGSTEESGSEHSLGGLSEFLPEHRPEEGGSGEEDCLQCERDCSQCERDNSPCEEDCPGLDEAHLTVCPGLYRTATGEIIRIDRDRFRIGKEAGAVDYVITDRNTVSRRHAEIRREEERFYISDLNSRNRTYVNGVPLPAYLEQELSDGDQIRLADEEFIFRGL